MSYLSRFEGTYEEDTEHMWQRRESIVNNARSHEPADLAELLTSSEDG